MNRHTTTQLPNDAECLHSLPRALRRGFALAASLVCLAMVGVSQGTAFCFGDGVGTACPCGNSGFPGGGCSSSSFPGAIFSAQGTASVANDSIDVHCSLLPIAAGNTAILFQGTSQANGGAGFGAGAGILCVGGSLVRVGTKAITTGNVDFGPSSGDTPLSVRGHVPAAGGQRNYQVWYRDALGTCAPPSFNFSNGLQLTWTP